MDQELIGINLAYKIVKRKFLHISYGGENKMADIWWTSCDNCWLIINTNDKDTPEEEFCKCKNKK